MHPNPHRGYPLSLCQFKLYLPFKTQSKSFLLKAFPDKAAHNEMPLYGDPEVLSLYSIVERL